MSDQKKADTSKDKSNKDLNISTSFDANKSSEYTAKNITVLEGLDPVKKRPGMYIGSTGSTGLHHLVWEVVDNAIDEAMAGHCDTILVTLLNDNKISVEDNGRGIPVETHSQTGKSALETVLTTLHAGGKFGEGGSYKVSGGLHGVGVSVVNALSSWLGAEVYRDGKAYSQEYNRGAAKGKVNTVGESQKNGTKITFQPDEKIFGELQFSYSSIVDRLRQQAYLTKKVRITIIDQRSRDTVHVKSDNDDSEDASQKAISDKPYAISPSYTFYFEGGIASYVRHLNKNKHPIIDPPIYFEKTANNILTEISLAYTDDFNEHIFSFANNIHTIDGGTHLTGFRTALTRAINNHAVKAGLLKESDGLLTGDDVREGLTAIISVKLPEPQFEGQTKAKLGNPEARTIVDSITADGLSMYLEEHPGEARKIVEKCSLSARARLAAKAARETVIRKGALEGMTLPGKLADCSEKEAAKCELYIVEGDSAGGCFSGDTKIALTDGRSISFKELVKENHEGKINYCYTIKKDGTIGLEQVKSPRITKKNSSVVKIVLDNNEEIICTPNHQFMLRDVTYEEAQNLTIQDSLMPFRRQLSRKGKRITIEGYELVYDNMQNRWIFTHLLSDEYNIEHKKYSVISGSHKHHLDFDKLNNNPDNVVQMSSEDHILLHSNMFYKTLHREDVKQKAKEAHKTLEYKAKLSQIMSTPTMKKMLSQRAKKQWESETYKEYMLKKFMNFYTNNKEYREKSLKILNNAQKNYWSKEENKTRQAERVKKYFQTHPEAQKELKIISKEKWNDHELKKWRSKKTREQWTDEFRAKRKESYNKTYLRKSLALMKRIYEEYGELNTELYNSQRLKTKDKSILKYETICQRFFDNHERDLREGVVNFNHKIKKIIQLKDKIDVYDMEVPNTHNFALASGVFVHNSAKQGRDRTFQAILPLRGKILNVERARLDRMLTSEEIKNLIVAMGCGIGEELNIEKIRYHRIIIMTDADVDGSHIRTLLLTFFYRHFSQMIGKGYLYIAQPPLYAITKGKEKHYAYTDEQKEEILKNIKNKILNIKNNESEKNLNVEEIELAETGEQTVEQSDKSNKGVNIQRYKGLGEMNPTQLWETTMDPANRVLLQVTMHDAEKTDEIFTMLMGDEVPPRKRFIQTHAKSVKNLDV